jgi:hypothetical protein
MTPVSKKQFHVYLVELAVIVLGILIAFQVEEWRDSRQQERDMRASLQRLVEETQANLGFCERILASQRRAAIGVEQAFLSLRTGILRDQDVELFEAGLRLAAQLPNYQLLTTVADEMISTGLLREINDGVLRQQVAKLVIMQRNVNVGYPSRRASVRDLSNEMYGYVDVEFVDPTSVFDAEREIAGSLEYATQVLYDFEDMAQNKRLKNLLFEALDSHVDHWRGAERLCGHVADIDDRLSLVVFD